MSKKSILVTSSSLDHLNFEPVTKELSKRGYKTVVFEPDSVARGTRTLHVHLSPAGELTLTYDGKPFVPEAFGAAWYRRPSYYGPAKDRLRWLSMEPAYQTLNKTLCRLISEERWLNSPQAMRNADDKFLQLAAAASFGFTIPETVTTNDWTAVEALPSEKVIVKMGAQLTLPSKQGDKIFPTAAVNKSQLPKHVLPYPGIWQPYLPKKREWRVTVVGERAFPVAVYTDKDAKDDWRKYSFSSRVQFKAEAFPKDLRTKCIALLKHYNLRYGAFDFVETPAGDMFFLEFNANGQYMWLEVRLGLPISAAIADELVAIAEK